PDRRHFLGGSFFERPGSEEVPPSSSQPSHEHRLLALEIVGTWVFAPTAAILLQMAELTAHGRTLRVAHFEQPRFAWS
ncbi:MAG: hypothetical protein MPN21_25970, partial [Thermoanaerobaculia bacterium]|nr:hypothetical protein [Thermoanaerobaculia bacterium]